MLTSKSLSFFHLIPSTVFCAQNVSINRLTNTYLQPIPEGHKYILHPLYPYPQHTASYTFRIQQK